MNPKKARDFKIGISEEVGVHPQVVEDFINFYFSLLRKNLSNLTFPNIYVDGLGTFVIRRKKLESYLKRQKDILGNITKHTYNGYKKTVSVKDKIKSAENMKNMCDELHKEKLEWQTKNKNNT